MLQIKFSKLLLKSRNSYNGYKPQADIEQLLDTTERFENSDKEILLDFCKDKSSTLLTSVGYHLISNGKKLLSNEIKRFIKITFTERTKP